MKTEQILNLDCTKEENKYKINNILWKVKPLSKLLEKNSYTKTELAPIELLEKALHGLCTRYGYRMQQIWCYKEENNFKFWSCGVMKEADNNKWLGDVYGITLWEIVAKLIIKIYAEERKNNE